MLGDKGVKLLDRSLCLTWLKASKNYQGSPFVTVSMLLGMGLWRMTYSGVSLILASTSTNTWKTPFDNFKLSLVTPGWAGLCEERRWSEKV